VKRSPLRVKRSPLRVKRSHYHLHAERRRSTDQELAPPVEDGMGLAPIRFVDDDGKQTEQYPFNPNGSKLGITGICSRDGRHLALMPHPERLFKIWQWPFWPSHWSGLKASPWLKLFQNARQWCEENPLAPASPDAKRGRWA